MSNLSGTGPDDLKEWICNICNEVACDPLRLEIECLEDKLFPEDSNGDKWLICIGCHLWYHLKCVNNLPKEVTEEDIESYYLCSDCGWCVPGAYDSE